MNNYFIVWPPTAHRRRWNWKCRGSPGPSTACKRCRARDRRRTRTRLLPVRSLQRRKRRKSRCRRCSRDSGWANLIFIILVIIFLWEMFFIYIKVLQVVPSLRVAVDLYPPPVCLLQQAVNAAVEVKDLRWIKKMRIIFQFWIHSSSVCGKGGVENTIWYQYNCLKGFKLSREMFEHGSATIFYTLNTLNVPK